MCENLQIGSGRMVGNGKNKTWVLASAVALALAGSAQGAIRTWVGADGGDWNTTSNWSLSKPVAGDTAVFNTALTSVTNAVANQSALNVSFDTNAGTGSGTFTIGTIAGNTLTLGNTGTVQILSTLSGTGKTITINSPITLTPASTTAAGSYTFANNSADSTNILNFGGAISASTTSSTETLTLNGSNAGANTINGNITKGSATTFALTKSGAGTWVLSGTGNSYNGTTTVTDGTLSLTGALTASNIIVNGATANFTESGAGVISGTSKTFTITNGAATLAGANAYTGATAVNGGGALTLDFSAAGAPSANIINNAANSSALALGGGTVGITFANGGTANTQRFASTSLTTATSSALGVTQNGNTNAGSGVTLGAFTRGAQSTVDFTAPTTGTIATTTTLANMNGVLTTAASNGVAYASANGGTTWAAPLTTTTFGAYTGSFSTGAANYLTANNADVTDGDSVSGVTVNTLRFNAATDGLILAGSNIVNTGGILITPTATNASITGAGTLKANATSKELVILNYGNLNVGAVIADNGAGQMLTLGGTGTTTLSAANTHTGATAISGGTVKLTDPLALQNSTVTLGAGSLVFDSSVGSHAFTFGGLGGSANLVLQDNAGTPNAVGLTVGNSTNASYAGVLSGTGSVTKNGTGTQTFTAASQTYTGATTVNTGTLSLNRAVGGGFASALTINSGATVQAAGDATTTLTSLLTLKGGTLTSSGNFQSDGAWRINGGIAAGGVAATSTISGSALKPVQPTATVFNVLSGATSGIDLAITASLTAGTGGSTGIIKTGDGVMRLGSGGSNYFGTTIKAGTILIGASNNAQSGQFPQGALGQFGVTLGDSTGSNNASLLTDGAFTFGPNGTNTPSSPITVIFGNSGTMTIGGRQTTGTSIFSGNIGLGNGTNLGKDVTLTSAGGEVDFTGALLRNGTSVANVTVIGTGTNPLVKLAGTNTYSGSTTVLSGQLALTATGTIANSTKLNVAGGTFDASLSSIPTLTSLAGGGTVIATTVNSSGTLAPGGMTTTAGDQIGTLTVQGGLTIASGTAGRLMFDIADAGATSDEVVTNSLTLNSLGWSDFTFNAGTFDPVALNANGPYTYTLFHDLGSLTGGLNGADLSGSIGANGSGTLSLNGNDVILTVAAVPEPTSLALLSLAGLAMLRRRRRR
jgi:autotransporter-associated beta strand protein